MNKIAKFSACLAGSVTVVYGVLGLAGLASADYSQVNIDRTSMGQVLSSTDKVIRCYALGKVSKKDYNWFFDNAYRLKAPSEDGEPNSYTIIDRNLVFQAQQEVNKEASDNNHGLVPEEIINNYCKTGVATALTGMDSVLNQYDSWYFISKY